VLELVVLVVVVAMTLQLFQVQPEQLIKAWPVEMDS
jgi:hypothetical protein